MMEYHPFANEPKMNPDPEWRYSLEPITPDPATHVPLEIPDRPKPTPSEFFSEMKLAQDGLLENLEEAHVLVVNNLGDVSFENWTVSKDRKVIHNVWWRLQPTFDLSWTISRFVVSMEPPASPPPLP